MQSGERKESHSVGKDLLYARLITLMQLADESARIAYPRRLHMPDINRQLIFMIGMYGSIISRDLATVSGRGKAQISRGLKALDEAGLIDRRSHRSAIGLSAAGHAIFLDIMAIARERDQQLCHELGSEEIARFIGMTGALIDRASSIFIADERGVDIDLEERSQVHHLPNLTDGLSEEADKPSVRNMVLPWLQSLMTYNRRSGTLVFKREAGLSHFEWRALSLIEENQPINLSGLIALIRRDKSQVARMVKQLHEAGLLDRQDDQRVNTALSLTDAGLARYRRIREISGERNALLFAACTPGERNFYLDMLDHLTANAGRMLQIELEDQPAGGTEPARAAPPARAKPSSTEVERLRDENQRLKQLLADAMLENAGLKGRLADFEPVP